MIRVAHVSPTYFSPNSVIGGGERYVKNLAEAIGSVSPFRQTIFSFGQEDFSSMEKNIGLRILANEGRGGRTMSHISSRLTTELIGYDLVHIHQIFSRTGAYAAAAAKSLRIPVVGTDLGGGGEDSGQTNATGALVDGFLSISRFAESFLNPIHAAQRCTVIGPVDTTRFRPRSFIKRERNLAICVGRVIPHKGLDRVIRALPRLLSLKIIGPVHDEKYFSELKKLSIGKDVEFLGRVDDKRLRILYCQAAVLVQASTSVDLNGTTHTKPELMGLTSLEALSSGAAVLVGKTGSLPELVTDHFKAHVFDSDEQLLNILSSFSAMRSPSYSEEIDQNKWVRERFGNQIVGKKVTKFYSEILGSSKETDR